MRLRRLLAGLLSAVIALPAVPAHAGSLDEMERALQALQGQMESLRKEIQQMKQAPPAAAPLPPAATAPAPAAASPAPAPGAPGVATTTTTTTATSTPRDTQSGIQVIPDAMRPSWLTDFRLGGYGSVRFEAADTPNVGETFTYRRFVLAGDATIAERLRTVFEIELERFTELEVERTTPSEDGARGFSQSVEGSHHSELSLEQAWLEFAITDWLKFRAGALLVPLGRFNLNHDDNRWDVPRRPLVDRGAPVLPSTAAWTEVGMGFAGDIPIGDLGKLSYQVYAMNGATLESNVELFARASGELEAEVEIEPHRGTADIDSKHGKAVGARVAWSPGLGDEIGVSMYYGCYTPSFLPSEAVWSAALDGKKTFGPFEIEAQYVYTRFQGIDRVVRGLANQVFEQALESGLSPVNTTIEFELAGLADTKHGYWVDLRYRFMPDFVRASFLAKHFENPTFVLVARGEQVWLRGMMTETAFSGGIVQAIERENRFVNRVTLGLAYRPVPLVVFQLALERTWTDHGKSLAGVTNFIPAERTQSTQSALLFGAAFGF
jgi:hypothetical protein